MNDLDLSLVSHQSLNNEKDELVANCDHLTNLKFSSALPYVFTEQGVTMLAAVLNSDDTTLLLFVKNQNINKTIS